MMNICPSKSLLALVVVVLVALCHPLFAGAADPSLKIALVHFKVGYKAPEKNLAALKQLHREAAAKGAKLIFNTELALSGYSFSSREDIRPYTRTARDEDILAMGDLARELSVYIGITFPQRDPLTDSFYNGATVFSPSGEMVLNYHKVYGEKRWARAGSPFQKNTFDTPWGRIGVAICADSYFGLIPRTLALKGADLVWVPANWPPTGLVSPLDVWQTRAMENGIFLAACNRTGKDRIMDCSKAVSAIIAPDGSPITTQVSESSALVFADLPLNNKGKLDSSQRLKMLNTRNPSLYRQIYLDPWTENLTRYYGLPTPGKLDLFCLTSGPSPLSIKEIEARVKEGNPSGPSLWVLPRMTDPDLTGLKNLARAHGCAFALSTGPGIHQGASFLVTKNGAAPFVNTAGEFPFKRLSYGPASIAMVPMDALRHPELSLVLSKLGCDLLLVSEPWFTHADIQLLSMRTLDSLAIAASGNRGLIAHMKGIHGDLNRQEAAKGSVCHYELDTALTRDKHFYDQVDFDLLLKKERINP